MVGQRHLNTKASISLINAEVENDQWESDSSVAQAYGMSPEMVSATLLKDLSLSNKSARELTKLLDMNMKKGASQDVPSVHSDNHHYFFTILDTILTVRELVRVKSKLAGLTLTKGTS